MGKANKKTIGVYMLSKAKVSSLLISLLFVSMLVIAANPSQTSEEISSKSLVNLVLFGIVGSKLVSRVDIGSVLISQDSRQQTKA